MWQFKFFVLFFFFMNIFVANLNYGVETDELRSIFEAYGEVSYARVVTDRETGQSRGFGFVEMSDDNEGREAIEQLNEAEVRGRTLVVKEARPREERQPRRPSY